MNQVENRYQTGADQVNPARHIQMILYNAFNSSLLHLYLQNNQFSTFQTPVATKCGFLELN